MLLPHSKSARAILATALSEQRAALLAALQDSERKAKARPIHKLRVAVRRLLAALALSELLDPPLRSRTARRLRELLDELSPLRDAHVQVRAVEQSFAGRVPARVLKKLQAQERTMRRRASRCLASFESAKLDRDIAALVRTLLTAAPLPQEELVDCALIGQLARQHLEIEQKRRALADGDAHALHRLRLTLKGYRYALEILAPVLPAEALLKTTAQLQDELGSAHDLHVLAETAEALAKSAAGEPRSQLESWAEELARASAAAQLAGAKTVRAVDLRFPFLDGAL